MELSSAKNVSWAPVYDRLRQLGMDEPTEAAHTVDRLTGQPSPARQASYRQRRKQLLLAPLDQYTDDVDRAADEIGTFFDHLRQVGIGGLVAERLKDVDYLQRQADPKTTNKHSRKAHG